MCDVVVIVATDTPETVDLLDVMNFLQYTFVGGKPATGETPNPAASPGPRPASRVVRAESTVGIQMPAQTAPPQPVATVAFERSGLGWEGTPLLEGADYANALIAAIDKTIAEAAEMGPTPAPSPWNMMSLPCSPMPGQHALPPPPPPVIVPPQRIVVVACPTALAASMIAQTTDKYVIGMVITVNSAETFPQMSKLNDLLTRQSGGKPPEKKKESSKDKKKGGEPGKPVTIAYVANMLKEEFASAITITSFLSYDIPNAVAVEGTVQVACTALKQLEALYLEYIAWTASRNIAVIHPLPQLFTIEDWIRSRYNQDTKPVDASTFNNTSILSARSDGWDLLNEIDVLLLSQVEFKINQKLNKLRVVQDVDLDIYKHQVTQRQAIIAKIAALHQEQAELQASRIAAAAEAAAAAPVAAAAAPPPKKGGAAATARVTASNAPSPLGNVETPPPPIMEVPPMEPLPTVGFQYVVQRREEIEPTSQTDMDWLVKQFVKKSVGKLPNDSQESQHIQSILRSSVPVDAEARCVSPSEIPRPAVQDQSTNNAAALLRLSLQKKFDEGLSAQNNATEHALSSGNALPSGYASFPKRSKVLYRATQARPELRIKQTDPSIRLSLLKTIESTHTTREKNYVLFQTLAAQLLAEQYAESAIPLTAHQYVETVEQTTVEERVAHFVAQYGDDVTRISSTDFADDNSHNLQSLDNAATQGLIIAAVEAPHNRHTITQDNSLISGVPNFTQYQLWGKNAEGDSLKSILQRDSFVGKSRTSQTKFLPAVGHVVFPHDGSVVRVQDDKHNNQRRVSFAKADFKAALHCEKSRGSSSLTQMRFSTTFDDGTVYTAQCNKTSETFPIHVVDSIPTMPGSINEGDARGRTSIVNNSLQGTMPNAVVNVSTAGTEFNAPIVEIGSTLPIPEDIHITVARNQFVVGADTLQGDVSFYFLKQDVRKSLVYGYDDATGAVVSSIEFEERRTIRNSNASITRFFSSGAKQILKADGSVATLLANGSTWLLTAANGSRYSKSEDGAVTPGETLQFRDAVDREANCRIRSRVDGVVVAEYFSPPSQECHTRVTAHTDGTVIVSLVSANHSSPILDPLFVEVGALSSFGSCTFVVETPRAPRLFLFATGAPSTYHTPINSFYVQLGDGSVFERHVMPAATGEAGSPYIQTVFCKAGESTLRYNHDSALMFVEPHDVHVAAGPSAPPVTANNTLQGPRGGVTGNGPSRASHQSANSIAVCEAIAVFDLALGGMRLVDRDSCVTTVSSIFDFGLEVEVQFVQSSMMDLLLNMLPAGLHIHKRSKRAMAKEENNNSSVKGGDDADDVAPLVDRLRLLAQTFVVDNRLVQLQSLRRPEVHDEMALANIADEKLGRELSKRVRPLIFAKLANGGYEQLMCAADLASFLKCTSNKQWTVTSSTCSGEANIEQISFYRTSSAALTPFEGTLIQQGPNVTPWMPKTMQPPRRYLSQHASSSSPAPANSKFGTITSAASTMTQYTIPQSHHADASPIQFGALRVLLRFTPLSNAVRSVLIESHIEDQERFVKMNVYARSLHNAIGREDDDTKKTVDGLRTKHARLLNTLSPTRSGAQTQQTSLTDREVVSGAGESNSTQVLAFAQIPQQVQSEVFSDDLHVDSTPKQATATAHHDDGPQISFTPGEADFGPLVPKYDYHLPVTINNHTSYTLLFEVFKPAPHIHFGCSTPSFVSVKTCRFMISPFGNSVINVLIHLNPAAVETIMKENSTGHFEEMMKLECVALKKRFQLKVTGSCNFAANAPYALRTDVHILGSAN